MAVIAIPPVLRDKLGDKGVEAFTEIIKEIDLEARKEAITITEERFERRLAEETGKVRIAIAEIRTEIAEIKTELKTEIAETRTELRTEIAETRTELRTEMERNKSETLKWMFIFWVGQIAVLSGIIFAMLKLYFK